MKRPVLKELFWVDASMVKRPMLKEHFTFCFDKPEDGKDDPDYEPTIINLYSTKTIKGERRIGLPYGRPDLVRSCLKNPKLWGKAIDKRPHAPLKYKLAWNKERPPHDYQKEAVYVMHEVGHGVLHSKPRTGKTVMATMLAKLHQSKVLIMAHQHTLLEQFLETFHQFTNIEEIEEKKGRKLAGICLNIKDFDKYDYCFSTYQMFLPQNGGKKKLDKIRNMFEVLIIDEAHREGAMGYINVIANVNARYRYGLTGTPDRKDGRYVLTEMTLGKVTHKTNAICLVPKVHVYETGHTNKCKTWVPLTRNMAQDEKRNKLIVKNVVRDIKNGHRVVVPITFNWHADLLAKMVNNKLGAGVAITYTGAIPKKKRKAILETANLGKTVKCVFARRDMLLGINVPLWSSIHVVMPISNPPNFEQEVNRVCTPTPDKKRPIIRMYVDDMGVSRGCFATCLQTFKSGKMRFTKKCRKAVGNVFAQLHTKRIDKADDFVIHKSLFGKDVPVKKSIRRF